MTSDCARLGITMNKTGRILVIVEETDTKTNTFNVIWLSAIITRLNRDRYSGITEEVLLFPPGS